MASDLPDLDRVSFDDALAWASRPDASPAALLLLGLSAVTNVRDAVLGHPRTPAWFRDLVDADLRERVKLLAEHPDTPPRSSSLC